MRYVGIVDGVHIVARPTANWLSDVGRWQATIRWIDWREGEYPTKREAMAAAARMLETHGFRRSSSTYSPGDHTVRYDACKARFVLA